MRVVYYTSAVTGIGRLIHGIAIGNALKRRGITCDYTMIHSSSRGHLAEGFDQRWVPVETEDDLAPGRFLRSVLYKTISKLKPDILLVNHQWFMVHHFIRDLPGQKIYLSDQAFDDHFTVPLPGGPLVFDPARYDRVLAIEPFSSAVPMDRINPLIMKNRDEILSREEALSALGLDGAGKVALYSFSAYEEDYDRYLEKYSYLGKEYRLFYSSTVRGGLFPIIDYFNAFDLLVCGAGYNQVWEANYFRKKAHFEALDVQYSDQRRRIRASESFTFVENGADQLAGIIIDS